MVGIARGRFGGGMSAGAMDGSVGAVGRGHALWVRLLHWLIVAVVLTLAYSGIVILMAHPRLYWGWTGNDLTRPLLELPLGRNYHHGGWDAAIPFFGDPGGPVSQVRTYDIFNQNGWARSLHFLLAWLLVAALGALCRRRPRHRPPAPRPAAQGRRARAARLYGRTSWTILPCASRRPRAARPMGSCRSWRTWAWCSRPCR